MIDQKPPPEDIIYLMRHSRHEPIEICGLPVSILFVGIYDIVLIFFLKAPFRYQNGAAKSNF